MTTRTPSRSLKVAAALVVVTSAILLAGITLNPNNQPPITVAPYALKDFDLAPDGTKAYRPWYENGAWQGDLIEYDICFNDPDTTCKNGQRRTDVQVGSNPPVAGTNNWMARATFAQNEDPENDGTFTDYWQEKPGGRHIFTHDGSDQVDFTWGKLTDNQKKALDIAAFNTGDNSSDMLDFLRGDHSNERSFDGPYRIRFSLLSDIINSWPVYLGVPKESYNIAGFRTFKAGLDFRGGRIFVGANDGMLHAFDEVDGSEAWAYIPSMLIFDANDPYQLDGNGDPRLDADGNPIIKTSKLRKLAALPYLHTYYVDGQLTATSAQQGSTWMSALSGGLGAGGKGIYILDVTDDNPKTDKILFELTGSEFGHIYGRPRIARRSVPDGSGGQTFKWYVVTGNGYGSDDGQAKLLMISLDDGSVESILAQATAGDPVADGLSAPVLVDSSGNFAADFAFAGDTNGDMWKFNLNNTSQKPVKIYDGNANQPITTAPTVGAHPAGGYMVFFGTGSATSLLDARDESTQQALLAIWDSAPAAATNIVEQPLVQLSSVEFKSTDADTGITTSNVKTVRYIQNEIVGGTDTGKPKVVDFNTAKGWMVNFPQETKLEGGATCGTSLGERVIGPPQLRAGRVSVMTTNPPGLNCDDNLVGNSWLLSLGYLTGSDIDALGQPEVVFNLSGDGLMNEDDMISTLTPAKPPVGVKMGDGNIAQPTFARLGEGSDIMLINGLRLPLPTNPVPGPFLNGHIDVETDSPAGGSSSPNNISDMSEGYDNESINDRLGKAIDGHVHDYDTSHGVSYVDIFQLEPRRGKASLNPTKKELFADNTCESGSIGVPKLDDNGNPVKDAAGETVLAGCLDVIDAELNRGYDTTLTNPDDPDSGVDESEVYILGTESDTPPTRLPESDQKFIVTLGNADLSPAGTLQIGCRIWNVVAYQDMITQQLEQFETAGITDMSLLDDKNNDNPDHLQDHVAKSLVFTLEDIANDTTDSCAFSEDEVRNLGVSREPTLRIGFNTFSILNGGIHGTRSQCVLGLHDARPVRSKHDKVCYFDRPVHAKAKGAIKNPLHNDNYTYDSCLGFGSAPGGEPLPEDYIRKPSRNLHITNIPNVKGSKGYRWRNGALLLQLLAVDEVVDPTSGKVIPEGKNFTLQPPQETMEDGVTVAKYLPFKKERFGGTYAKAFKFKADKSTTITCTDPLDPLTCTETTSYGKPYFYVNDDPLAGEVTEGPNESGMLYEATMYWHYSALADELRRADPASIPCYGDPNYGGALKQELGGLTLGEYNKLIADLGDPADETSLISQYAAALQALQDALASGDEGLINQALLDLGNLLDGSADLALYDKYRDYAPGHIPEQHLLDIDKGQLSDSDGSNSSTLDGTPEDVETLEDLDTETIGPNFDLGRRTWIDPKQ